MNLNVALMIELDQDNRTVYGVLVHCFRGINQCARFPRGLSHML
jgi:hypothetical protein